MQESNNLTQKKFWSENWKMTKLPARYFYNNYARKIIADLIGQYVDEGCDSFLEIGGCPGKWADYFFSKFGIICDSMDYDESNVEITRKNYALLNIKGKVFLGDITDANQAYNEQYDIVLSDGLIEHFSDSAKVFANHLKFLKKGGLLVIGVPNIKKSWFYNFFARQDEKNYNGYRHVDKKELESHAKNNGLEILFCGYLGVFNLGLIHSFRMNFFKSKLIVALDLIANFLLKIMKVKKETETFSPAIYLIAKNLHKT